MPITIDLDIGGTYTDCYLVSDGQVVIKKVPTTHFNLSVGFMQCIEEAASAMDISLPELLDKTDVIRYSTTIGTNTLIERSGPKLGLITTMGHEDTIYIGRLRQWADGLSLNEIKNRAKQRKPEPLIPRDMTVGVRERVDCFGNVTVPLKREDVMEKVQQLVDRGAQGFVISLIYAVLNPVHERMIRDIIEEEYPDIYLGKMPIFLSSDVYPRLGEYPRTMTTIINAYTHRKMAENLAALGDELRDNNYRRPLIIMHNTGGCAKVSRTAAVNTHNAGPVAGVIGSAYLGRLYGENLIVTDMGGTSFDLATIVEGRPQVYDFIPVIDRWRTAIHAIETKSIGAGGGSIAWVDPALGRLQVGPRSSGSMPGPAAYDLGGKEPTVTDADVVLGYLDPGYYLGGKIHLNKEKAERAIREKIAVPLNMELEEAAVAVKRLVDANMGQEIFKEVVLKGHDPRKFVMFAYGGAGATHCCGYDEYVKASKIVTFPYSSVFCAFGASTAVIVHTYTSARRIVLHDYFSGKYTDDYRHFIDAVREMQVLAAKDMADEGFEVERMIYTLDLEMKYGTQVYTTLVRSPRRHLQDESDVKAICDAFTMEYSRRYSSAAAYPQGGIEITSLILTAVCPVDHMPLEEYRPQG